MRRFRSDWLIPALGVGLVAGLVLSATTYRRLELEANEEAAFVPVLDRLCQDHDLSLVLKLLQEGRVDDAKQRLDRLLCWDVLRAEVELERADGRTRAWTECILRRIARARPKMPRKTAVDSALESGGGQVEAERVLERILREGSPSEITP